ncbi:hypothetical protein EVAR_79910_1 [Eumeta japonica]|uniref:Uncharacterized protein n=1 Tax=Eumeta variegata TaxID=151549 RepID=A0A4C1TZ96_EUMVA|nr:hypothetical protein EVAR_79910_1 [Eumeta japonica]
MSVVRKSGKKGPVTVREIVKEVVLGPDLETKFEELKSEIMNRIDKELCDSQNTRDFITQKYENLCQKIQILTEVSNVMTVFRRDFKALERQIEDLSSRVTDIEKRSFPDIPSLSSALQYELLPQ